MSIWWILLSRLKKHSLYHLFIPLVGGILVEFVVYKIFPDDSKIVSRLGISLFRTLTLILGVGVSWLIVMFFVIDHETKKRVDRQTLATLQKTLNKATSYHGVSVIPLTEWFDPAIQLYLAKLVRRKFEAEDFEHQRTLLFFSSKELKYSRVPLVDENHYGRCLAFMHGDYDIPLSFLERKEIFEILGQLAHEDRVELGCYPSWTNWGPLTVFQNISLYLRRRIHQLDFALVTTPDEEPFVLRVHKSAEGVRIEKPIVGKEAQPYRNFVKLIQARVYDEKEGRIREEHDFLTKFGLVGRARRRQERDYRRIMLDQLAAKYDPRFRMKRYTRFVEITEKSGDMNVREEFEGVTAYPTGAKREKLPRSFTSKFGFLCEPKITEAEGGQIEIGWEWDPKSQSGCETGGFVTFDSALENDPVRFVMERKTHNAFHFNQRDRQDTSEEVSARVENLIDLYVLKVRFPKGHFPSQFKIQVKDEHDKSNDQEERLARTRFARFASDRTAVLILERPLPGHIYRIVWNLPKDDIEELRLSGHEARILRAANKRLVALRSDADRSQNVRKQLDELQRQIANATIGPDFVDDPGLELALHAYNEENKALVMVASNGDEDQNVVEIGRSTVGQAYKRRALVNWALDPSSDNSRFWDYSTDHSGIVSIPLFYPLDADAGGRTCVLSVATKSPTSGFLNVIDMLDDRDTRRAFTQHINAWYARSLASALGLPDLTKRMPTSEKV